MIKIESLPIVKLIGNTPLYKMSFKDCAEIWIKLEGTNPGGSIKDRAVFGMLQKAEKEGLLTPKTILVEPTSGNTGIGLALLGRAIGLRVILTMPDSMSIERRAVLKAFGAELILTPAKDGMSGSIAEAEKILLLDKNALMLNQFKNKGNAFAHETTTGPEIIRDLPKDRSLAAFVSSFGTGGTLSGIAKSLKSIYPNTKVYGVEPKSSPLLTEGYTGSHKIQGIGANFIPENLDVSLVDKFVSVSDEDALEMTKKLASEHGLFSGISTGANVFAALEIAKTLPKDNIVVTVQPDRGDKYLSIF
ncbi:MAG: cysteine synthase A [Synergistaceae bacterium]